MPTYPLFRVHLSPVHVFALAFFMPRVSTRRELWYKQMEADGIAELKFWREFLGFYGPFPTKKEKKALSFVCFMVSNRNSDKNKHFEKEGLL